MTLTRHATRPSRCAAAVVLVAATALGLAGCQTPAADTSPGDAGARVTALAARYYAETLLHAPETAYFAAVPIDRHDRIRDNSPEALAAAHAAQDELLAELRRIDGEALRGTPQWVTHGLLVQALTSAVDTRICRTELWNVNQMGGWQSSYVQVAQRQPVGSASRRQQSLRRWEQFPGFIDQELANLQQGLALGYSAPKAVVHRVVAQLDALLALDVTDSPFYSPAVRDPTLAFAASTHTLVSEEIYPALTRMRDYLAGPYLAQAREALSVTANPDGAACYEASLRSYTTLDSTGKEIYELGQKTVAANRAAVIELGRELYGTADFKTIIELTKADPADHFASAEELLAFSRDAVRRAANQMAGWISVMPDLPVAVVPFDKHEEGTGRSAHYRPGTAKRPAEYRIPLFEAEKQSRGNAEATAFHETWPGHHLQSAAADTLGELHPATRIIWFSGPGEGWARYSEALAEEMGLYSTASGPILRRAWPARGMVVDPGIHLFGWTREQAIEYIAEAGRMPLSRTDDMVDRIAILPGQLTAYDAGGLEILALRREAEAAFGNRFSLSEFHTRVLENGTIPLSQLRSHIEAWIEANRPGGPGAGNRRRQVAP